MTLADLPGNTYVYFTTQGWNSQTDDWIGGTPALVTAGYTANGYFWKTPSGGVPKGTILNYIGATGEISSDWVWLNYDESLYFPSDQWLVFTKSSNSPSNVSFVYAANFSDTDQDASGFQTSFGDNDLFRTAVPPGLVAATSGQEGSAFGLAPTSGYDVALKPSALTDGMTRAEVLQAIHTPSNWEVYDDEAYIGFDFSTRYPASITISGGASNEAPTDLNLSNLSVNQSAGISAFIGTLSSTDANEGDAFVYSLVAGEGDTNNSLFDISGSSLLARNAAAMPAGSYSLRVQTDDALGGTYSESFMITVVDDVGPVVSEGHISISGASGTGGAFRIGDTITATWNNTAEGENNTDTLSAVTVDFSSFGGGTAVSAINSSGMWTASLVVPAGSIDEQNRTLSVTATDAAGNTTTTVASTTATLDNIAPTVTDGSISISGASGTGDAFRIGDTITVSWNNTAGGDNNNDTISAVTVDFSSFGGGTAVSASNRSGTWTATYTLAAGSISASGQNVSVRAIDDAGNETRTFDSTGATIDIIPPEILSIKRKSPLAQLVREGPLLFEVTFSEDVTSVDASSFAVTAVNGSTVKGEITEISGGPKVYEVTVGITEGRGEFRLDVVK
jgi:hypothetical protein